MAVARQRSLLASQAALQAGRRKGETHVQLEWAVHQERDEEKGDGVSFTSVSGLGQESVFPIGKASPSLFIFFCYCAL